MDKLAHLNNKIFYSYQWNPNWFVSKHKEFETKGRLSPYLFVIAREAFSCLLKKVENGGYLSRWWVRGRGGDEIQISHLLFVNDTFVFCEASQD